MSQGNRRHGGGGYTLLYYIGLEGKEDRRTEEQKTEGQKNRKKETGRKTEGQKNRKNEKGKDNRRTKEQKQVERGTGKRGTRTGKRGHADRKKPVNFLQKPRSNLTEPLEQCSSYPVALLRSCWRKFTEGVGNYAGTR